ncbi:MAG: hypothetical protein IKC64_02415 [Clostridia bacterium]|nr:hypothetical protein [Clostridia bacterium]
MRDLLKADIKRVLKDKLFIVISILAVAFALITPLLTKALVELISIEESSGMGMEMLEMQLTAKSMFFSSFSPGNNFGLILPIMMAIILCKDFNQGTVRNKIICGKSRSEIYFSMLTTCVIFMCSFVLIQAVLTLLFSLVFFDYQVGGFTAGDFGYLMASIGFEILVYFFICALLTFFIVFMKNAGLAIVMYFVVSFVFMIVGTITQTTIAFVSPNGTAYAILEFLNTVNVFTSLAIGNGTSYTIFEVLSLTLPNIAFTVVLAIAGWLVFKKKDLK